MRSKLNKKSAAANKEEVVGLVLGTSQVVAGHWVSSVRWQRILAVVLAACFALFLWETLEVDRQSGDVQLKLHTGNKRNKPGGSSTAAPTASSLMDGTSEATQAATEPPADTAAPEPNQETAESTNNQSQDTSTTSAPATTSTSSSSSSSSTGDAAYDERTNTQQFGVPIDDDYPIAFALMDDDYTIDLTADAPEPEQPATAVTDAPKPTPAETTEAPKSPDKEAPKIDTAAPLQPAVPLVEEATSRAPDTTTGGAADTVAPDDAGNTGERSAKCAARCANPPPLPTLGKSGKGDMTRTAHMKTRFLALQEEWKETLLKPQYGAEHYQNIFEPLEDGVRVRVGKQRVFRDPTNLPLNGNQPPLENPGMDSWSRMVRKYQLKLTQVQLGIINAQLNPNQQCMETCHENMADGSFSKFVWVNGGHSASAGHGDMYRESYTATLGRDVTPILKQIGLDFQVRNYAMGGTSSGEEVGLCANSIFGRDVDSISWDYGMTDGHDHYKIALYAYRAARLAYLDDSLSQPGNVRHRPSLFGIHQIEGQNDVLQSMQALGMTVLGLDVAYEKKVIYAGFPDMFGMTDAQIAALPPFVQYFKCQDGIESGDPGCKDNKFNHTVCADRKAQVSWHPGWKHHGLTGHLLALTIFEVIGEALTLMINGEPTGETLEQKQARLSRTIQELSGEEQKDYEQIFTTPVPDNLLTYFDQFLWKFDNKEVNKEKMKEMSLEMLIKHPAFCHTAMLPAEIRYKGILTENFEETGDAMNQVYEKAFFQSKISASEADGAGFVDPTPGRETHVIMGSQDIEWETCEELIHVDHKDYFYISSTEGWRTLTIPNEASKKYYTEYDVKKGNGWIFLCPSKCDWGKCTPGDIQGGIMNGTLDGGEYGKMELMINDEKVTDLACMCSCCALMHGDTGAPARFKWPSNSNGQYEIKMQIAKAAKYGYARLSSFILV